MNKEKLSHNQHPNANQYQNQRPEQQYMPQPTPPQYQQPLEQTYYKSPTQPYNPPPPQPPAQPNPGYYPSGYRAPKPPKKWYQNGWMILILVVVGIVVISTAANSGKKTDTVTSTSVAASNAPVNQATSQVQVNSTSIPVNRTQTASAAVQPTAVPPTASKPTAAPPTTVPAPQLPGLNQKVQVGEVALLVASVGDNGKSIKYTSYGNTLDAVGTWITVKISITNTSNKTKSLSTWDFVLTDAQGRTYEASSQSFSYAIFQNLKSPSDPIPPGSAIETTLLFDVTQGASGLQLVAKPDFKKQVFKLN